VSGGGSGSGAGSFLARFARGLSRSRAGLGDRLAEAAAGKREIDAAFLTEVEEILVTADLGVATAMRLMDAVRDEIRYTRLKDPDRMWQILKASLLSTLHKAEAAAPALRMEPKPAIFLMVGVNGVGKTTTIGKLAARYRGEGRRVILSASDTFRAAAVAQLVAWGERTGAEVVRHREGADSSAVAYDACEKAVARGADLVLVDTAGRLHTNVNLMEELRKVHRVIGKVVPGAPHEVLLVLDANTGQNALAQGRTFLEAVPVSGLVVTKMDSTAKGGILVNLVETLGCPVRFVGIGEAVEDLTPFDAEAYVAALLPG
jgi:fused signal recognition particle receptor